METSDIWIIIVTFNNEKYIHQCLGSVREAVFDGRVVVVDNGSTDNTVSIIKEQYSLVNLIESNENMGFGRANNIGMSLALDSGAEFIFLLNQDAWINQDTLPNLKSTLTVNNQLGVVSPLQMAKNWTDFESQFESYLSHDITPDFLADYERDSMKPYYLSDFLNAATWLISRNCINQIGGFDPLFFMYGEDDNWLQRMRYHGFHLGLVPSAKAVHARNNSSDLSKPTKDPLEFSRQRILKYAVQEKVKLLNVHSNFEEVYQTFRKDIRRKILSTFFRVRWSHFALYRSIRKRMKSDLPQIRDHRQLYLSKAPHFIEN